MSAGTMTQVAERELPWGLFTPVPHDRHTEGQAWLLWFTAEKMNIPEERWYEQYKQPNIYEARFSR